MPSFFGDQPLHIEDWGVIAYREAWERQKSLVARRQQDLISDTLIFCEHNPAVITLGRGAQRGERPLITAPDTQVIEIERGGLATWHGPGQLVVYPILRLDRGRGFGVVAMIRALENWVIAYLATLGIRASAVEGNTGVWVEGERKIASIGVAVSHWISYHGLSFNYATGMEPWRQFNPCGFSAEVMTDLKKELRRELNYVEVRDGLIQSLTLTGTELAQGLGI